MCLRRAPVAHAQLRARVLGCSPPEALAARWPAHWSGCNYLPEDLHPRSFRAYFGHNTNVWAAASAAGLKVSGRGPPPCMLLQGATLLGPDLARVHGGAGVRCFSF